MKNKIFIIILASLFFSSLHAQSTDLSLILNGNTDYVNLNTSSSQPSITTEFSVESWVKFDTSGILQPIVQYGICNGADHSFNAQLSTNSTLGFSINDNGNCNNALNATTNDSIAIDYNSCYHIVYTFKAPQETHIYVNGSEMTSSNNGFSVSSVSPSYNNFKVGAYENHSGVLSYFKGGINNFGLFNTALTSTQVLDHYNNGITSSTSYLQIFYSFDAVNAGTGQTVSNDATNSSKFSGTSVGVGTSSPQYSVAQCYSSAGIDFVSYNTQLKAYPNPVYGTLTIESKENITIAEFYDINGRLILSTPVVNNKIEDLQRLALGMYHVKLHSASGKSFALKASIINK
ncbi:MAG: hypothetical protein COA58_06130 [Bacteroidetes bacterium]|nr:MAG: hypothetical protein COA58_06130 [Bacteroidota bacterium]